MKVTKEQERLIAAAIGKELERGWKAFAAEYFSQTKSLAARRMLEPTLLEAFADGFWAGVVGTRTAIKAYCDNRKKDETPDNPP
jgi:hypothetical protein